MKMGKSIKNLIALFVIGIALGLTGCIVGSGSSNLSFPATQIYPGQLSGQIFDATTGAPISGVGLTVELIQGSTIRTPDTLITSSTDPAAGDYGFANIPVEATAAGNQFKLIVNKPGYQPFESEFAFGATIGQITTQPSGSAPYYSKIGDVYLYPVSATAAPIVIHVRDGYGRIVSGATVELLQYIAANSSIAVSGVAGGVSPNILPSTAGLTGAVATAVTDLTGAATFPGGANGDIALGAEYVPVALGMSANGFNLATATGTAIIAGTSPQNQTLSMTVLSGAALTEVGRSFVVGKTPPLASGILNVIFNQPFTLDATSSWAAALYYTPPGGAASAVGAASGTASATAIVTGSSLVITPAITNTNLPASGVYITYTYPGAVYTTSTGQYGNGIFANPVPAGHANATAASGVGVAAGGSVQLY